MFQQAVYEKDFVIRFGYQFIYSVKKIFFSLIISPQQNKFRAEGEDLPAGRQEILSLE
ncbi:hypothetical protein HZC33_01960 [Candidatus Wolfebacteria bacterium]|nr:hypothetical protein [Candidatus Wolfebacteria bacterium]